MSHRLLRLMLALALLVAALQVGRRWLALGIALRDPTPAGVERALGWDPGNPDFHLMLAGWYRDLAEVQDLDAALHHAERAAELSPYSWIARWQLAQLHEVAGRPERAEEALLAAIERNPVEVSYSWRLANLYLRAGRLDDALPPLRRSLAGDRSLWRPGLALLLKLEVEPAMLEAVWPDEPGSRLFLARELTRLIPLSAPERMHDYLVAEWDALLATGPPPSLADGALLSGYLLDRDRPAAARRRWIEVARAHGLRDEAFEGAANLVWNGRFELPPSDAPLAWRLKGSKGATAGLAGGEGLFESTALRIDFAGGDGSDQPGVGQRLLLCPGAPHELTFQARSRDLARGRPVWLEIYDPRDRKVLLRSDPVAGTTPWSLAVHELRAPAGLTVAELRLRRAPGQGAVGRRPGSFWLDSVSLAPRAAAGEPAVAEGKTARLPYCVPAGVADARRREP